MKKNPNKSANGSTKRELVISCEFLGVRFKPDAYLIERLLIECPEWVPANIIYKMWDSLSGYCGQMQEVMVRDLSDFMWGTGRKLTGIDHVDSQLLMLYKEIYEYAQTHDHKLECPCPF